MAAGGGDPDQLPVIRSSGCGRPGYTPGVPSDAAIGGLRAALEEEREALKRELGELGYGSEQGLSYDANFADTSQVTAERGETGALVARLVETLSQVERALDKFDAGTYGVCEGCGGAIAPARLEAKPEARHCIDCAAARR